MVVTIKNREEIQEKTKVILSLPLVKPIVLL
jgi:hypothetical protein